jgi:hypothetical protein
MPGMDWCENPTNWYKECSGCKTGFWVEAEDFASAIKLMLEFFAYGRLDTTDGLQCNCRSCQQNNRKNRNHNGPHREDLLASQGGRCAIKACKVKISFQNKVGTKANVDHDHKTKKIRGILCSRCNIWMASIDDDKWLAAAMAYRDSFR